MRRNVRFCLLAVLALALGLAVAGVACTSTTSGGAYADLIWRVRCINMGMCTPYMDRSILGYNLEEGNRVSCNVIETATNRTLSFSVSHGSEYGLSVTSAQFPRAGGSPAAGCSLTVTEDNRYEGACGGTPPSEGQPCQISNVRFTRDPMENRPLISGNIYCVGLSPRADASIDRELTAPGNTPDAETQPMQFNLYDCTGYNPD